MYDVRLLEALRRISALERERIEANAALNAVLSHSLDLERRLCDTQGALTAARLEFRAHLAAEIDRVAAENDALVQRLRILQSSTMWRVAVAIRSVRARLRKRG